MTDLHQFIGAAARAGGVPLEEFGVYKDQAES